MKGHQKVHELYKKKYFVLGFFLGVEVEGYFYFFDIHRYAIASNWEQVNSTIYI